MRTIPLQKLKEVATLFLKLGTLCFGGPAAHVAVMHNEIVKRRKWIDDQHFLDLLGATQLIPGPNSTEMAIHIGFVRAGWAGLITGGACFTFPSMFMVMVLSWVYVHYGSTPQAGWILYGIKPVVIAIIMHALWVLRRKAIQDTLTAATLPTVILLFFLGINEIALLFGAGLLVMVIRNLSKIKRRFLFIPVATLLGSSIPALAIKTFSLPLMFLTFLKIGTVWYGGGYVLLAYFRADFVMRLGWLSNKQLMDAIAVGQITPGPLFTTATFIGYILNGVQGALLATLGILLPSFIFVVIANPFIQRIRTSSWASSLLDGVNAASLGLMAAVTWYLGKTSLIDPLTIAMLLLSLLLLARFKINSTWLIMGGAIIGLLNAAIG